MEVGAGASAEWNDNWGGDGSRGAGGALLDMGTSSGGLDNVVFDFTTAAEQKRIEMNRTCYRLSVGVTFAMTLMVFPAVTSAICSVRNPARQSPCDPHPAAGRVFGDLWVPAIFLLFNVGDLLGRLLANAWPSKPPSGVAVLVASLARLALFPPLLLCNVVTPHKWALPHVFMSDLWPVVLVSALAVTNGHLGSTAMMYGPALVPLAERAEEGSKMSLALTCGLTLGCFMSMAVGVILQSAA